MKNLIFLLGPTAVGKTSWALTWAEQSPSCILNSDSIQCYTELNIGSAKPNFNKYPHIHFSLFNEVSAPYTWTVADFRKKSLEVLKKKLPIKNIFIVGGSGFYIQALEKGLYPVKKTDKKDKKQLEELEKEKGLLYLYNLLKKKDPETAKQISSKDQYRIFRSLLLIKQEKKKLSEIKKNFQEQKLPYPYFKVGLTISKEDLFTRVKNRSQKMLKEGLIEEVECLLKKGLEKWPPLNSVGYKEACLYLKGKIKKEELCDQIITRTMSLAKKQKTWLKKDQSIKWYSYNMSALKVYKELFK